MDMEAPSRGMLRRPIGLLPSAATRAERIPESIGHVSVHMMPAAEQMSPVERSAPRVKGARANARVQMRVGGGWPRGGICVT